MKTSRKNFRRLGPVIEAFEPRILLTAANDLSIVVGTLPTHSVLPGDKVDVPIIITNVGSATAAGNAWAELSVSDDLVLGDDHYVDDVEGDISLDPGESLTYVFHLVIPPDAPPGEFYLLAQVGVNSGIVDPNSGNDTDFSEAAVNYWRFGTFDTPDGTRTNFKLTVESDAGQLVSFMLTGGGWGEVDNDTFDNIVLHSTTVQSVMQIKGPSAGTVSVGNFDINGPLKQLNAKTADMRGSLTADGVITNLTLNDVDMLHGISMNTAGPAPTDPKIQATITLGQVAGTALNTNGVPIKSLTVLSWDGGSITAPWIGKLAAKGNSKAAINGDFSANLTLSGAGSPALTLGGVNVAGELHDSTWDITGNVGAIDVKVGMNWMNVAIHSSLKSIKTYWFEDCDFTVDGPVGSVTVAEDWNDSDLTADSLKTLKVDYFGRGRLTLVGVFVPVDKPVVLGSAKIGYIWNSAAAPDDRGWKLYGDVGSIAVGDVEDWFLNIENANPVKSIKMGAAVNCDIEVDKLLGSIQALDWDGGSLEAGGIKSVKITGSKPLALAGHLAGVDLTITGEGVIAGQDALGSLTVAGMLDQVNARIAGNAGTITAGAAYKTSILIGCGDVTGSVADFDDGSGGTNQFTLKTLALKGYPAVPLDPLMYFDSFELGVWFLTSLKFSAKPAALGGVMELNSFDAVNVSNPPDSWAGVTIYEVP